MVILYLLPSTGVIHAGPRFGCGDTVAGLAQDAGKVFGPLGAFWKFIILLLVFLLNTCNYYFYIFHMITIKL